MKTAILGLLISFSLIGCSVKSPYYADMSLGQNYQPNRSIYSLIANWHEDSAYDIPDVDKAEHERCVYFALDQAQIGESCKWRGVNNTSNGTVRILVTQNFGGKTCRMINSNIVNSYKNRNFTQYACTSDQGRTWQFHSY